MVSATRVFGARGFQIFAEDLGSHSLATEQAFGSADAAQGNDLHIGPNGCARCPVEVGAGPGQFTNDLTTENTSPNMLTLDGLRHRVIFCKLSNSASFIYFCL